MVKSLSVASSWSLLYLLNKDARSFEHKVYKDFVQEGCTVNAEYYKDVLDRLISRIRRVRPALYRTRDFFLLHDNAPAHSAAKIRLFLTQKQVATLNHTPYSPDFSPP